MALKLSWHSWPGEVADAAKNAFSDPGFLITLVLIIAVYVGLWLTPEPTMITKVAAGVLTVVLLAQFAWEDIYGLAKAWMTLQDDCGAANSVTALQAAGDMFAKKVGQVGFDILMAIAMWGMGKAAGPKVSKLGAQRATARATADVAAAEAKPGSGVPMRATGEALKVMDQATARAQGTGTAAPADAAVLDALGDLLTERGKPEAVKGLKDFRAKLGDANAKRALESELGKGNDLASFLTEKGMTPQAKAETRAQLEAARVKLARAKLIELKINEDPHLRARIKVDLAKLAKQLIDGKIAATDEAGFNRTVQGYGVTELVGEIGEALARERTHAVDERVGQTQLAPAILAIGRSIVARTNDGRYKQALRPIEFPLSNLVGSHGFADGEELISRDDDYLRYVQREAQAAIASAGLSGDVGRFDTHHNPIRLVGDLRMHGRVVDDPERELAGHRFQIWALDLASLADWDFWSD